VIKIAGIYREKKFSNRAVNADKAIMDKTLSCLAQRPDFPVRIDVFQAEDGQKKLPLDEYDYIFSMAQNEAILTRLQQLEHQGVTVLNSTASIRNCYRSRLSEILGHESQRHKNLCYPEYIILGTADNIPADFPFKKGCWVKRGDFHAVRDNDVRFVENPAALHREMAEYATRGISHVVCQENITGHIIKFYGVGDGFFSHRYMGLTGPDRYDLPEGQEPDDLDLDSIRRNAALAARKLGLAIYGGDCIVDAGGRLHFIDVNDWPSFRTCADEAAIAISDHFVDLITGLSVAS